MPRNKPQTWQAEHLLTLPHLGQQARTLLEALLTQIDVELGSPVRLSASFPTPNSSLHIDPSTVPSSDGSAKAMTPVGGVTPSFVASTIDFQAQTTTGGTVVISWPASSVGLFRRLAITLDGQSKLNCRFSNEFGSVGSLPDPAQLYGAGQPVGWIDLQCTDVLGKFKTAGSITSIIENSVSGTPRIFRTSLSGGGTGNVAYVAQELPVPLGATTVSHVLTIPQPDVSYVVLSQVVNVDDGSPSFLQVQLTAKSKTDITFKLSSPADTTNYKIAYLILPKTSPLYEFAFGNATDTLVQTLLVPQPSGIYSVLATIQNLTDPSPTFETCVITAQASGSLTALVNDPTDSVNYKLAVAIAATAEVPLTIGATSATVPVPSGFGSTNFLAFAVMKNLVDGTPQIQPIVITGKTPNDFTVSWNVGLDSGNYSLVCYVISFS